jgi:hypothetical protein
MKKAAVSSILIEVVLLVLGVIAEANRGKKVSSKKNYSANSRIWPSCLGSGITDDYGLNTHGFFSFPYSPAKR